jgi:glycosyltransferase involved in cell wall biosynthesis
MGGVIYVINIVRTLNALDDKDKPEVYLFYSSELSGFLDEFKYPYLKQIEWRFPTVVKGNLISWIKRKNIFYDDFIKEYSLDAVYPAKNFPVKNRTKAKVVAWYADLQHKYYPEFFSRLTRIHRSIRLFFMLRNASDMIVSSQAVLDDFRKFYKLRSDLQMHVYHFTSINDNYKEYDISELRIKYNLPGKYFLVSNQFHKHKNHRVLLLAAAKLKKEGIIKHLAITGKFPEAQDSPYLQELIAIIESNNLKDQISLLGIIPRDEQIALMKNSQAVLQPSLFEGWSTVIEDAISLQVPVIASNIPVNIEHLKETGTFFDPHNADELASLLRTYPERDFSQRYYDDYSLRIRESAELLLNVLCK